MRTYRWKFVLGMLCAVCFGMFGALEPASAAEADRMEIGADGMLTLHSQQAMGAGVSSLQFSVLVQTDDPKSVTVDFVPDGNLDAKVVESFWHADTGRETAVCSTTVRPIP